MVIPDFPIIDKDLLLILRERVKLKTQLLLNSLRKDNLWDHWWDPEFSPKIFDLLSEKKRAKGRKATAVKQEIQQTLEQKHRKDNEILERFIEIVIEREMKLFVAEVKQYQKKKRNFRFSYQQDIERARAGKDDSLDRIIRWDKGWLFIPWVRNRVMLAQEKLDSDFLKDIGDAVAGESGRHTPVEPRGNIGKEASKEHLVRFEAYITLRIAENPTSDHEVVQKDAVRDIWTFLHKPFESWWSKQRNMTRRSKEDAFRTFLESKTTLELVDSEMKRLRNRNEKGRIKVDDAARRVINSYGANWDEYREKISDNRDYGSRSYLRKYLKRHGVI